MTTASVSLFTVFIIMFMIINIAIVAKTFIIIAILSAIIVILMIKIRVESHHQSCMVNIKIRIHFAISKSQTKCIDIQMKAFYLYNY